MSDSYTEIKYTAPPQSRNEAILVATVDGTQYTDPPQSRVEDLLLQVKEKIEQGGSGGTSDYTDLANKPQINDVTLSGNKSGSDLGLVNAEQGKGLSTEDFTTAEKTKLAGLTNDYTNLNNKPQINGTTLTGDKSSADLGLLSASTRYGASISANKYIEPMTGKKKIDTSLKDQNGNAMATITSDQPVIDIGCDSSGLLVEYPSARASVSLSPAMSGKVDKVQGKGLSAEDFTAMYKAWIDVSMLSPINHNGIYRGKDLTDVYTIDQMYDMNHAGTFDDLFLGDYFTKSITTDIMTRFTDVEFESGTTYYEMGGEDPTTRTWTVTEDATPQSGKTYATKLTKTENVTLMFAGFNYYYNIGTSALATPNSILIPRGAGFATTAKMNSTNTTAGGYYGSDMHQITLPCYAKSIKSALNNHLLSHWTWLTTTVNTSTPSIAGAGMTGAASASAWKMTELQLMTEQQVYGTRAWTSSAYDVGIDYRKLPIFDFINPVQYGRADFWLRSVVNSTSFANCSYHGIAIGNVASNEYSVRPLIIFG